MEMYNLSTRLLERCTSTDVELTQYMRRLMTAKTNRSRVNIVYKDLEKHHLFPNVVQDIKSDVFAISYREKGNQHFGSGNYLKAVEDYTRSIATSQTPSIRAVAYANRSACLFRLNRHRDIERALANNYPDEMKEKIIKRRQQAEKLQKPQEKYHEEVPKIPEAQKHPMIQCASNCVKIEFNEEYGRHIIATRDIEIDEIIAIEKPFACAVKKEYQLTHCHNCMELCYNPIPCNSCTQALFCGEACKDQAQIYHKYECSILLTLVEAKIDCFLLVVRVALLAKTEYEQLEAYHFNKNEYYRSDRYKEIHCLKGKPLGESLFDAELLNKIVCVAAIFHWLQTTDFFENENIKEHFKQVMLSQLQIIPRNGMAVSEYAQKSEDGYMATHFADAILSFGSLFNHSCCRYISRYSYGSTVVFRSCNKIKNGQQCYINYGPHYDGFPKWHRQLTLNQNYLFTCKCVACEKDWDGHTANFAKVMNLPESSKKLYDMQVKIFEADLGFAKEILPFFLKKLKRCEHNEPWGDTLSLKKVISHCYKTMGNKRRM